MLDYFVRLNGEIIPKKRKKKDFGRVTGSSHRSRKQRYQSESTPCSEQTTCSRRKWRRMNKD